MTSEDMRRASASFEEDSLRCSSLGALGQRRLVDANDQNQHTSNTEATVGKSLREPLKRAGSGPVPIGFRSIESLASILLGAKIKWNF